MKRQSQEEKSQVLKWHLRNFKGKLKKKIGKKHGQESITRARVQSQKKLRDRKEVIFLV